MEDIGGWFTQKVWGWNIQSSTGMTPISFLYFAGGNLAVFIVFFIIGIMQNTLYRFLTLGAGGIIIYFGLLQSLVMIDSAVNGLFINWMRMLPALIILQSFLLRKNRSHRNQYS
jgi:hypothetical protein